MSTCHYCGFQNPEDIHICLRCASSLKRVCPKCGVEVTPRNRFCGQCGAPLEETGTENTSPRGLNTKPNLQERVLKDLRARMPENLMNKIAQQTTMELSGQRREVTVLFANIANFTSISQVIDSEDLYLALDDMMRLLADIVYKYEGTIDKFTGDGLMALFGIPLNHENDPERAVRAALEMQLAVSQMQKSLQARYQAEFTIRVGVNTGSVIAGTMSTHEHMEYTVIGDTVNLASRLQLAAAQGQVLVSFSTYQRSRPIFDYQVIPALQLKGFTNAVQAYCPTRIRLQPGQVRGLPGMQVPLIGRGEDLTSLITNFENICENKRSHIVLCSGEAGIGKTRLVAEFQKVLANKAFEMFQGTCAAYMRITPYRVVADVVRNMIRVSDLDVQDLQREALRIYIEQLNLDLNDVLPYLLHVLGLLQGDPVMEVRIRLLEPAMLQRQTLQALRMLFIARAKSTPMVLVFDDLHWVDPASRQFLEYFSQSLDDVPLMLMLVARDFELLDHTRSLRDIVVHHAHNSVVLELHPLSFSDSRLLVDQLIQETTARASIVKASIVNRAAGNPYYTEEMVRTLIDHGGVVEENGAWLVTEKALSQLDEIPGTLQDIILSRFDCLTQRLRKTLQKIAALGNSFSLRLVQALFDDQADAFLLDLTQLELRGFVIRTRLGIDEVILFKHPLLQETFYNTLLKRDQRRFHDQIAKTIESGDYWLPGERNEILAYHYSEGLAPTKAIPYLLASAEKASQQFTNELAIDLYRRALALMIDQPGTSCEQLDQARVGLGQALKFTGMLDEGASVLTEVIHDWESGGDVKLNRNSSLRHLLDALRELADIRAREGSFDVAVRLLGQGLDLLGEAGREQDPVQWRRLADRLAWVYFRQERVEEAYNLADLALIDVRLTEVEDPITLASLYNTIGGVYWMRGRISEAIESVERSLALYKNLSYQWGMAIALTNLGVLHFSQEKWQDAVGFFEQADSLRREFGYDLERPVNLKNLGEVLLALGDRERARSKMETSRDISKRLGMVSYHIISELGLCSLAIEEDNMLEAAHHLQVARDMLEPFEEENDRVAQYYRLDAQVKAHHGQLDEALQSAQRACQIASVGGYSTEQNDAYRVLGTIYGQQGSFELGEENLLKAIELARQSESRYDEALAMFELGRIYYAWGINNSLQNGLLRKAVTNIDRAISIFENLGARQDLYRAKTTRSIIPFRESAQSSVPEQVVDQQVQQLRALLDVPSGEWSQVTVLSVYLEPHPDTDEEEIFETIGLLVPVLSEIVRENEGQILLDPYGLTVIFGAPQVHEDDPQRAIDTAILLVNFYYEIYKQTQMPINIRLGISMGRIVAGCTTDNDGAVEFKAAGQPIIIARQLAEIALPQRVWVTLPVRNVSLFRFEYTPVPNDLLADQPENSIFQLEGLREQMLPVRGLIGLKSPFVGRQHELSKMQSFYKKLEKGAGGIIWLNGEPGIGKSRLMREFTGRFVAKNILVWQGNCSGRRSDFSFSLFNDLLSQLFDIQPNDSLAQIYSKIETSLNAWPEELQDTRPFLELLVGVQPSGSDGGRLGALEPEQLRRQVFVAVHRIISILAVKQPIVLILDDLHWIDPISADLLLFISHLVVSHPVMFVCAQRIITDTPIEIILERIRTMHSDKVLLLPVEPLTGVECRMLLKEFLLKADLPESVLSLIVQQSGGNPYFIEEFVRMLVEQDYLRVIRGQLEINQTLQIDRLAIPSSLETLIGARVDSLPHLPRQILQVASVIGRRFDRELLAKVAGREDLDTYLALLHSRGMLKLADEDRLWEFSHPLIEVIVYNTLLRAQRRVLHSRTAHAIEAQWQENASERAEELAYHFGKAEEHEKALFYLILAGERATTRHSHDTAVSYFERALDMLSVVEKTTDELRWRILSGLGEVYQFTGNYSSSMATLQSGLNLLESSQLSRAKKAGLYRRMGDTAQKLGDQELAISYLNQALEILGDPLAEDVMNDVQQEAAGIYGRLGWSYFRRADMDKARAAGEAAEVFARRSGHITALAAAENLLGGIYYRQGDLQQAIRQTRQAMTFWDQIGYSWGVAVTLGNLGILEVSSGNWNEAFDSFQRCLSMRKEMGDVEGVAIMYNNLGNLACDQGNLPYAEMLLRDSLAISRPFQMAWQTTNSLMGLAQVLIHQGDVEQAANVNHEATQMAVEINALDLLSEIKRNEAEIYLLRGQHDLAEAAAAEAARMASKLGSQQLEASCWRIMAESLLQQGNTAGASSVIADAWDALSQEPDRLEMGRTHAQTMRILQIQGVTDEAVSHYQKAAEIFRALGAARDLNLLG